MLEPRERISDKAAQESYYRANPYDEIARGFWREYVPRDEVHEIEHGSSKTYEPWNMISLSRKNHDAAHDGGKRAKRRLYIAKIICGTFSGVPPEIIRAHGLERIMRRKDVFLRRWMLHRYREVV